MNCQLVHLKKTAKQQQKTNYTEFSPYAKTIDNGNHNKNNNDNDIDNNNNYNHNNNNTKDRKLIEKRKKNTTNNKSKQTRKKILFLITSGNLRNSV